MSRSIDFTRDIKPIFEKSCVRCHGTERPKSKFSLATRETALKGGENGIDIIPGDSTNSPLIHYVARLVAEMEMPPDGKGDPLTREQISVLRAWIDQGVAWEQVDASAQYAAQFSFTPAVRWASVSGNAQKFQEHQWARRGFTEGVSDFRLAQKLTNGVSFVAEGHALTDDYKVTLDIRKEDLGFARFGFEQFRKYYDDRGPYYPFRPTGFSTFAPNSSELHRDLHLDLGKAFAEFGLTLPDWPRITIGYEYQFKNGEKSTEQWGPVEQRGGGTTLLRNIYPAWKDINEDVHIVKLDVSHDLAGIHFEDNARAEFWDLKTKRVNDIAFPAGQLSPSTFAVTHESHDQFQFVNTLRGEKPVNDWLFLSAGYLFTQLDADATLDQTSVDGAGRPALGVYWAGDNIVLKQSSHVFNLNGQGGPWDGFTAALGIQNEFSEQDGFGNINRHEGDPNDPTIGLTDEPSLVRSDIDKVAVDETVLLRYHKIPMTALFAEARLKQERIGHFEEEAGSTHDFLRDTDTANDWQEYRTGFSVSPWRAWALHAEYKHRRHKSDFDDDIDSSPTGYSAFIRSRDSETDAVETRLVFRPATWIKTSVSYQFAATDYRTTTDPTSIAFPPPTLNLPAASVHAGKHDSSTYSANVTLIPWRRLSVSTTVSFQESRIVTYDNLSPSVVPYDGNVLSVLTSATFALNNDTDCTATYSFSRARYGQGNFASGLPLGIDYDHHGVQAGLSHRFNSNVTANVQYGFFKYDEPTSGGFADYSAHVVFGALAIRLP